MVIDLVSVNLDGEALEFANARVEVTTLNGLKTWIVEIDGCVTNLDFDKGRYVLAGTDQFGKQYSGNVILTRYLPVEGYVSLQGTGPLEGLN